MKELTIMVQGMSCGHCKKAVEDALMAVDGVVSATVNLEENNVLVVFDEIKAPESSLKTTIEDAGYDVP